ncbi:B12-binding domain-containing radical SAM protein [Candidatus Woesearchaeota archaeon]|nr:B12-binding domain-containing radical SAM protein [Candidatus Woesearchaeota archaeon]
MDREILLLQPKSGNWENLGIRSPDGLLTMAALPKKEGYNVKILDLRLENDWKAALKKCIDKNPLLVATSCMTGIQIKYALEASRFVKQHNKDIPVIWGGIHPTFMPYQTLENENIDIVVIDEGDLTFLDIIKTLEANKPLDNVLGIAYKDRDGKIHKNMPRPLIEDLDSLPDLPYELIDVKKYYGFDLENGGGSITLNTSRGCPFKCNFCYDTKMYGNTWRGYSAKRTIEIIKNVVDKFGIKNIFFQDDNFATNLKRFKDIVYGIIDEKLDIKWGLLGIRLDALKVLDDNFLRDLAKAGCVNMDSGVESGSDRILKMIKKGTTVQEIIDINKKMSKHSFKAKYTFIVGYPSEAEEELIQSIKLATTLVEDNKNAYTPFFIYTAYPGVELWEIAKQYGVDEPKKLEDWETFDYENAYMHYKWLDKKRIKMMQNLAFTSNFANKNIKYKISKTYLKLLFNVYQPIAKVRFKYNLYQFPIDIKLGNTVANALY